jgi:PAS domain S-box-containing protein
MWKGQDMLKNSKRAIRVSYAYAALALTFLLTVFSGCVKVIEKQPDAAIKTLSFRNIPGITQTTINDIEALQKKYGSFTYGMDTSTEAFIGKDGGIHGYATLFCDWLTGIFGIPFKIAFYDWGDLLKGLESGEVDFTGELMTNPERQKTFFMTGPIVDRSMKIYRIRDSESLQTIIKSRPPRYAFLRGSVLSDDVKENAGYDFETVFIDDYDTAYRMLKSGEIDAYFGMDTSDVAFKAFSNDVVAEDFYPLIFKSSCLSTQKAELAPIINAVDKLLDEQTLNYLSGLYKEGHQQYLKDKLYNLLTNEERAYIQNNPVIPVAAEFDNYPVCFFDTNTNQWHGIYFDTLEEITKLTGLAFKRVNDENTKFPDLIAMLENGSALIIPELFRIKEYEGRFLWSEIPLLEDNYAFLSKSDFENIEVSQIPYLKIGVRREKYAESLKKMFPNHRHLIEYDTQEEVWNALKKDEVELIFACNRRLITYTNYYEEAGYKLNLILNYSFDTSFGYNKDSRLLKSIVDKALGIININNIANQWMHKSYDYRYKMAAAQRPWLIGAAVLFFLVLLLMSILLIRSRSSGRQLEDLVAKRTADLAFQTSKLKAMIDSIPDLMFCKDTGFRYTQCNRFFEQFMGVSEEDLLGKADKDGTWLLPEQVDEIYRIEQDVMEEDRIHIVEERVYSPITGKECVFETVKAPIRQDGAVVGIVAIIHDITKRKEMEKDLAFQTSLLKTMISSLPDAVFCKDLEFKYTLCNKYLAEVFNREVDDMLGKNDTEALGLSPKAAAIARDADMKVVNEKKRVVFEEWITCADGVTRLFETVKSPLILDGNVIGIMAIGRDITRRKEMEEEAMAASRAKTSFLANMSHELRTPLNVVIGLTDLLMEDEMSPHMRMNLLKISNAGNILLSIVNDILDFSKIESGKLELSPIEYYVSSLLNDIITLVITRLGEKPIQFHLNINDDLPNKLFGDDLRVKQILTNLLTNAVKYTREGSIELSMRCVREGDTMWLDAAVSDTGMGIPKEDVPNLFLDYYQVSGKSNRNIEGTGLGLPITKRLVEMMNGELSVVSESGKGSTFSFRIKQGYVDNAVLGPDVSDKLRNFCYSDDKRVVAKKLVRVNLSYARVLVVDDMETNLDVAAGILHRYNMQVDCLNNGQAAIDRIREGTPVYNAIFMDHMMPGIDGIETVDRIRAIGTEYAKKVPIIALTANAIHGTDKMFYEHDFQEFITKPIDVMEMDAVLRKWVRDKSREEVPVSEELSEADKQIESMAIEIPGVNTEKGLSLYAGSKRVYLPLLRSYVSNTPGILDKLRSVSAESLPNYVISVHGMKGTSAGIGAEIVREAALELENISRAGDLQGVLAKNDKLIADAETLVSNIKAWLGKNDIHEAKPRLKAPDKELLAKLRQGCESYDMESVDKAMAELEKNDYEENADLIPWLRGKIETSEFDEVAERIAEYEAGQ